MQYCMNHAAHDQSHCQTFEGRPDDSTLGIEKSAHVPCKSIMHESQKDNIETEG